MLKKAGLKPDDAELVKTGGFGPMVAALELGQIDAAAGHRTVVVEDEG